MARLTGIEKLRAEGLFKLKVRPGEGMCPVHQCRKKSRTGSGSFAGLCHAHMSQRFRRDKKVTSVLNDLRSHAKARGLECDLHPEYLAGLMDAVGFYDTKAESRGETPSLDRVDCTKGYVRGNLRVVSLSVNAQKGNRERRLPESVQALLARKRALMRPKLDSHEEWQERNGAPF
jgi:hypothetical protein